MAVIFTGGVKLGVQIIVETCFLGKYWEDLVNSINNE